MDERQACAALLPRHVRVERRLATRLEVLRRRGQAHCVVREAACIAGVRNLESPALRPVERREEPVAGWVRSPRRELLEIAIGNLEHLVLPAFAYVCDSDVVHARQIVIRNSGRRQTQLVVPGRHRRQHEAVLDESAPVRKHRTDLHERRIRLHQTQVDLTHPGRVVAALLPVAVAGPDGQLVAPRLGERDRRLHAGAAPHPQHVSAVRRQFPGPVGPAGIVNAYICALVDDNLPSVERRREKLAPVAVRVRERHLEACVRDGCRDHGLARREVRDLAPGLKRHHASLDVQRIDASVDPGHADFACASLAENAARPVRRPRQPHAALCDVVRR